MDQFLEQKDKGETMGATTTTRTRQPLEQKLAEQQQQPQNKNLIIHITKKAKNPKMHMMAHFGCLRQGRSPISTVIHFESIFLISLDHPVGLEICVYLHYKHQRT